MGGNGDQAGNIFAAKGNKNLEALQKGQTAIQTSPGLANALEAYGSGKMSLQEAQDSARHSGAKPEEMNAFNSALATGPQTGSRYAQEQIFSNPMTAGIFGGKGSYQQQLMDEQQGLAGKGFQLTPEDREAYGQASGDIARQFGQEEGQLSSALASRGLAAAPSGAATVGYSGLMGNKNERLAKAQTDIANQRMQNNMQRLQQTRAALNQTVGQGQEALQGQFGRNLAGAEYGHNAALGTAKEYGNLLNSEQAQINQGFQQQQQTKGPSFGDVIGGIATGGLGALTGGIGTAVGAGLGKSIIGGKK